MPSWGYLLIAIAAYLGCCLVVYLLYCAYLTHGKKGLFFVVGTILLNLTAFKTVKLWKRITGKRLWWEKHGSQGTENIGKGK